MPGDPRECRERAARCLELAVGAANDGIKQMFLNLARHWEALAQELERAKSILDDEKGGLRVDERKPRRKRSAAGRAKPTKQAKRKRKKKSLGVQSAKRVNGEASWSLW